MPSDCKPAHPADDAYISDEIAARKSESMVLPMIVANEAMERCITRHLPVIKARHPHESNVFMKLWLSKCHPIANRRTLQMMRISEKNCHWQDGIHGTCQEPAWLNPPCRISEFVFFSPRAALERHMTDSFIPIFRICFSQRKEKGFSRALN